MTTEQTPELSLISTHNEPHSEAQKYVEELIRLACEVKERLKEGESLQVLSSLAAIPGVHMSIVEKCKNSEESDQSHEHHGEESRRVGLYL